jgi:N-acetyl sugar amidotransferase
MNNEYNICKRCVMDTTAQNIAFDKDGNCNFCDSCIESLTINKAGKQSELNSFIQKVKDDGKNKKYDCVIGVSGGVDSSYALYLAVKNGLRPLAVHMDNGWNSELATNNIANLVNGLGVDLYTHVIDWQEYKDLMESFFKANVIDIELLYDNAMLAVNFQQANKFGIKYILPGYNSSTEGIGMPKGWNHFKLDVKNIKNIQKKFGTLALKTMPMLSSLRFKYDQKIKKIQWVAFLDYFDYKKEEALTLLKNDFSYKPYPYKHYESIFTRFYQGYILPEKFGVDKRRVHLSSLICSHQMSREEAMEKLTTIPYPSQHELEEDIEYFLKKMSWSREKLDNYISQPEILHDVYGSEKERYYKIANLYIKIKSVFK